MAGDLPPRCPSATPEDPLTENPDAVVNPGNVAGTSNVPENTARRNGKGPAVSSQSANQGVDSRHHTEQGYQLTPAEQEVIRLNRILAETTRQLDEARARQGAGRPRNNTSRRTETTRTETVHTVGQTYTGPVTRQAARTAEAARGTGAQMPQGQRRPPSPIRHPPSPIRHPEPPRNEQAPLTEDRRGSQSNRTSNQGDNHPHDRRAENHAQRHQAQQGYRQPEPHGYRENSYREASVGSSRSASSRSGHRTRSIRREPDLREHLNLNRGFEPRQPDLRDKINE